MYCSILSAALCGIEATPVRVEADVSSGLPVFSMVGYLSSQVREAEDRVRTSLKNLGIAMPPKRITINLAPGDIRKEGTRYDLPIAAAVLSALGILPPAILEKALLVGELQLNGQIIGINGILPSVLLARKLGCSTALIPFDNLPEGQMVGGIRVIGLRTLRDLIQLKKENEASPDPVSSDGSPALLSDDNLSGTLSGDRLPDTLTGGSLSDFSLDESPQGSLAGSSISERFAGDNLSGLLSAQESRDRMPDFSEIRGQKGAIRASLIAAAGFHNLLLYGPPGSGKSMTAERIPSILPPLSEAEALELTKIYSVAGQLKREQPLICHRPFRSPHHTISPAALAGGGLHPQPGEITLAHLGVLFLDELPEMNRQTIELLRQPLENHTITIARSGGSITFPAAFLLVAAMNPCPCGHYPNRKLCRCTPQEISRYQNRISQAFLDRIDLCVHVDAARFQDLFFPEDSRLSSAMLRAKVLAACEIQRKRYKDLPIRFNSQLSVRDLSTFCPLSPAAKKVLEHAFITFHLSARGCHRLLRISRTIADLAESDEIKEEHMTEALFYRFRRFSTDTLE